MVTFYDLLWIVGVNDFILKFMAVLAKILVTISPARVIPYQKRGKYYLFLEVTSQLHRQLAPLQPWLMYLLNSKGEGAGSIPNKVQCNVRYKVCHLMSCVAGVGRLPHSCLHGGQGENLCEGHQALERGGVQTYAVNKVEETEN